MLIEQLINLEKVRAESADNLKFRTDLQDLAMDGWSVTQDEFLQRQIAQKILKSKIEARPVNTGHCCSTWLSNIAFHLRPILQQTLVAINSESRQTLLKLLRAAV